MAKFFRGDKTSLLRALGIMYGSIVGDDHDPIQVLTIKNGQEAILAVLIDSEEIRVYTAALETAMGQGVLLDLDSLTQHICDINLPDGFYSTWQVVHTQCEDEECPGQHLVLINQPQNIQCDGEIEDFFDALDLCEELFGKGTMTWEEGVWVLQQVLRQKEMDEGGTEADADQAFD